MYSIFPPVDIHIIYVLYISLSCTISLAVLYKSSLQNSSFKLLFLSTPYNPICTFPSQRSSCHFQKVPIIFPKQPPHYIGCICMGFQIGLPSALKAANASRISVGQLFHASLSYSASWSPRTCWHIASLSISRQLSQ